VKRVLITGGAGFVGGALARSFLRPGTEVVVFDNLRRRGSEWNLSALLTEGVRFVHGDVRNAADLASLAGNFDVLIEASAEPSVHAGVDGSPRYVLDTNLGGALNCLDFASTRCAAVIFLSSSRVYSIAALRGLPLVPGATRFELALRGTAVAGVSDEGIAEDFSCARPRSYYGASKLAAELLCEEYAAYAKLPVVINRCGVIAGPGQFGKTDQGVFTLWVARHFFGRALRYTGFGGTGLQVRDLLHPLDLADVIHRQLENVTAISGQAFNVGGGQRGSVSLREFTNLCREATAREVPIEEDPTTSDVDLPWYVTDHRRASSAFQWSPTRSPRDIVADITSWVRDNQDALSKLIV
jgi:CDP-paratose 2-epimerase